MSKSPYRLVHVEWEDSAQPISNWVWIDEHATKAVRCISVGYLIAENKNAISIAANLGNLDRDRVQASGVIQIPRSCIIRTRRIKE